MKIKVWTIQKVFLDSNFIQAIIDKMYIFFTNLPQISHTHKNRTLKSIIGKR